MSHVHRRWALIALAVLMIPALAACTASTADENNRTAVETREETFNRAQQQVPDPQPVNFPMRQALVEFVERQDMLNHPFYVYLLGIDGSPIGYFVGQTYPISTCNFLSSSERVRGDSQGGNLILTAPSIDGMFYGGGGAAAGCTSYFMFDVATDTLLVFDIPAFFASDQPLDLDVPLLSVASPEQVVQAEADGSLPVLPAETPAVTPEAITEPAAETPTPAP